MGKKQDVSTSFLGNRSELDSLQTFITNGIRASG